jgi:hypothetical protein
VNFTINTTLQPGQNETGVYSAASGTTGFFVGTVNFRIPLSANLPGANVTFIPFGGTTTTACPGPGIAAPGQLCVYEGGGVGYTFYGIVNPATNLLGASRWGFTIFFTGTTTTCWTLGSWTVAAPDP